MAFKMCWSRKPSYTDIISNDKVGRGERGTGGGASRSLRRACTNNPGWLIVVYGAHGG